MVGSGGVFFSGSRVGYSLFVEDRDPAPRVSESPPMKNTPNGVYIWGFAFLGSRAGTFAYIGMYNMILRVYIIPVFNLEAPFCVFSNKQENGQKGKGKEKA